MGRTQPMRGSTPGPENKWLRDGSKNRSGSREGPADFRLRANATTTSTNTVSKKKQEFFEKHKEQIGEDVGKKAEKRRETSETR